MPPFAAVVFDFDFTLADSSTGVVECINYALQQLGLPLATPEAICRTIGLPMPRIVEEVAGREQLARADEFARAFRERADVVMEGQTHFFPDAATAARQLHARGLRLGVVSNKFRYRIAAILAREGLSEVFSVLVGYEDMREPKPAPEGLLTALTGLGATPATTLYVGDSVTDAQAAARAGVPFVGVLSGVTTRDELAAYPHLAILPRAGELVAWMA